MWIIRVIQPILMSCIIFTIEVKASLASELYIIETTSPVIICRTKVIPKRKPMFHIKEIEVGVGKSNKELFTIFRIGLFFILKCWSHGLMRIETLAWNYKYREHQDKNYKDKEGLRGKQLYCIFFKF